MFDWFEKRVREAIWKALNDFFNDLAALAEAKIIEKLQSLTAGQQLSTTPLIRVTGVDLAADTFQILVRGAFTFEGITPFMRLEVSVARSEVDVTFASAPIKIEKWILNRTITIGVQHVADGGVQSDFVISPTVLPAIAP